MKLSLVAAAAVASLAVACGNDDDGKPPALPQLSDTPPADTSTAPPPRKLVDGHLFSTSPVNLLTDPGFSLTDQQQAGYGSFLAFYEGTFDPYQITAKLDSRSPAGFSGGVAVIQPAGATDKKSDAVMLLTSFLGGQGPFHAQIWVSKSDVKGEPVDLPTDGTAVKVSVMDSDPEKGEAFDLKPVDGATRAAGGRTWVLLKADITKPLQYGGFFVIHTGKTGGFIHLAAPEVTSDQVAVGQAVMSRGSAFAVKGRMTTTLERTAIQKYKSIPPRLVPAAPKLRAGL